MTKDELADKHMCRATGYSLACEILDGSYGDADTLSVKILEWVKEDFLSGYSAAESEIRELREKLGVAEEALDFTLHAAEYLYQSNKELPKGLGAMFYHTLTYEGDLELIQKTKKAREALSRIRGVK